MTLSDDGFGFVADGTDVISDFFSPVVIAVEWATAINFGKQVYVTTYSSAENNIETYSLQIYG